MFTPLLLGERLSRRRLQRTLSIHLLRNLAGPSKSKCVYYRGKIDLHRLNSQHQIKQLITLRLSLFGNKIAHLYCDKLGGCLVYVCLCVRGEVAGYVGEWRVFVEVVWNVCWSVWDVCRTYRECDGSGVMV